MSYLRFVRKTTKIQRFVGTLFMINTVAHIMYKETNTNDIGENIVRAHYDITPQHIISITQHKTSQAYIAWYHKIPIRPKIMCI